VAVDVAMFSSHSRQSPLFSIFQLKLGSVAIVSGAARGSERQPAQCQPPTLPHRYIWRPQSVRRCLKVFEGLTHFNTVEHAEIKDRFETPSPKTLK